MTYAYDSYGMPQSVTDGSGTESYAFNASDVLSGITTTYKKADGSIMAAKTLTYTYNADGSRNGMSSPGGAFSYAYDALGRAQSLLNPQSETTSWSYLDNNWLKSQTLGNGAVTTYTLNMMGQRLGVTNKNAGGTILSQFGHTADADSMLGYDGEGKLMKLKSIVAAASTLGGTTNCGYDTKNQLTTETSTKNGSYSNTFGYDAVGNGIGFYNVDIANKVFVATGMRHPRRP